MAARRHVGDELLVRGLDVEARRRRAQAAEPGAEASRERNARRAQRERAKPDARVGESERDLGAALGESTLRRPPHALDLDSPEVRRGEARPHGHAEPDRGQQTDARRGARPRARAPALRRRRRARARGRRRLGDRHHDRRSWSRRLARREAGFRIDQHGDDDSERRSQGLARRPGAGDLARSERVTFGVAEVHHRAPARRISDALDRCFDGQVGLGRGDDHPASEPLVDSAGERAGRDTGVRLRGTHPAERRRSRRRALGTSAARRRRRREQRRRHDDRRAHCAGQAAARRLRDHPQRLRALQL
jgi:hypothetical protein